MAKEDERGSEQAIKAQIWTLPHDHGQDMKECYDLKQQIEILVGQGKL